MNKKNIENINPKTYVLEQICNILKKCDEDIKCYMNKMNDDFLHYFTIYSKSHVISTMMRQQLSDLRTWLEAEDDNDKIIALLNRGIQFMTIQLLDYKRIQTTNELHNLVEEYKLEMYSSLIPTYQQMIDRIKSLMA